MLVKIIVYFPEIVALAVCAALLLGDIDAKQGYHMDELLSFELANAEFNPWIVPTQPQGRLARFVEEELRGDDFGETFARIVDTVRDVLQNRGTSKLLSYQAEVFEEPVWISGQTFRDYITVGEKDGFNYLSVYFNVKDDNHPPLHFMALHTVSSLFRGRLTPLMGCGINLVCVLVMMMLLMRLGRQFMTLTGCEQHSRRVGIWAAVIYALSAGAMSTVLLIRMYAMVALFCVALFDIHLSKLCFERLGGRGFDGNNKLLILVTALGFWTQYFFLFYCLTLAAVTAVILWRQRRLRELWRYICSMVTAAVIGVLVFPFSIADVFQSGRGVEALGALSSGFAGYGSRLAEFLRIVFVRLGVGFVLVSVLFMLCCAVALVWRTWRGRNKERSGKAGSTGDAGIAGNAGYAGGVGTAERVEQERGSVTGETAVWCLLCIPVLGYFLLAARMSPYLVDRYVMPLFPFLALTLVLAVCRIGIACLSEQSGKDRALRIVGFLMVLVTVGCQLWDPLRYQDSYLYQGYDRQLEIAKNYAKYPCICVYEGVGYYENLLEFACYDRTLLVTGEELADRQDCRFDSAEVVVLLKHGKDREQVNRILEEKYGMYCMEVLQENGEPYGDTVLRFGVVSDD